MTERQLVDSAEVDDLVDVEIAVREVFVHSKTRHEGGPVAAQRGLIQYICGIGQATVPGEVGQDIQAAGDSALIVDLHGIVVAVTCKSGIGDVGSEIGIRNVVGDIQSRRQHLMRAIRFDVRPQMMNRVSDIARLHSVVAG